MRGLGQYLTRRVLGYLVVAATIALLSVFGIGRANAADIAPCTAGSTPLCDKGQAYSVAFDFGQSQSAWVCADNNGDFAAVNVNLFGDDRWRAVVECSYSYQGNTFSPVGETYYIQCVSPEIWNDSLKQCVLSCPGGYLEDPFNAGTCMDYDRCRALNSGLGMGVLRVFTGASFCPTAGCNMIATDGTVTTINGQGGILTQAVFEYSGASCSPASPVLPSADQMAPEPPKPQECVPASAGQTFCVKPDGQQCHTATTGKQICWQTGETGEKSDGPAKQKRDAGPTPIAPNLTLPNGDTLTQTGDPVTTTTTNNTTNVTTTTTTTTYTTVNGTNAGAPGTDAGEPGDGTGSAADGDGKGSASGGVNCEPSDQPVVSGDPLLAMITLQTWATRCAVESKDAVTSTGDITSCASDFTVSGPPKSAELLKLKVIRAKYCGDEARRDVSMLTGENLGNPEDKDGLEIPGVDALFSTEDMDATLAGGGDASGFGFSNSTCPLLAIPDFQFRGHTMTIPWDKICLALEILAGIILLAGHVQWAFIVAGIGNK